VSDDPVLQERDAISDEAFRELLNLFMASDPWPLEGERSKAVIFGFLCAEASKRGYDDWIEAYHEFDPEDADD